MSWVFGLVLKWHDNSELSLLGDASAKIPWLNGISKLDREFSSRSLRKSEETRARIAVDQEIEATSSLKDLINPKSITRKDFSGFEELDLMMCRSTRLKSTSPWNRSTSSNVRRAGALVPPPSCLGGGPHGWVPVYTHSTPVLPSVRRLWVAQATPRAQHSADKCVTQAWEQSPMMCKGPMTRKR